MNVKNIAIAFALGCAVMAHAAADKVIGFFPYWSQYSQFYPKDIRYSLLTHIHYANLNPASDGSVALADENDAPNVQELSKFAAENGVKLVVSVGGMEMESTLQEIAASEELRNAFASNLVSWMQTNGFSGVELDWQNLSTENTADFTALLSALQSAFAGNYTLSSTVYPLVAADAYDVSALNNLDYVTVFMPDQMSEEESALKPNQSATFIEETLNSMADKGLNKDKMVPVVYLYGKSFSGATGLGSSHSGIGSGNEGYLSYKELMGKFDTPDYTVSFDDASKSEYAVSASEAIVFMGIPSVKALSENVKNSGFAGVAVYDLSQDHHESIVSLLVTIGLELRPDVDYKGKKKK